MEDEVSKVKGAHGLPMALTDLAEQGLRFELLGLWGPSHGVISGSRVQGFGFGVRDRRMLRYMNSCRILVHQQYQSNLRSSKKNIKH